MLTSKEGIMIRIGIADDHYLIREGFQKLIDKEIDMTVVFEAENGAEVLEVVRNNDCDVIVLDIHVPGRSGLDLLTDLREMKPETKVLILTMQPEDHMAIRTLKTGASGYVTKDSAPDDLIKAIRKVHGGGKYISETLAERLAFDLDADRDRPPHETLSDREFQVFQSIGEGRTMNEICQELSLSLSTVNTYRARVLQKMNMQSNAELIHYAIKNNLVN